MPQKVNQKPNTTVQLPTKQQQKLKANVKTKQFIQANPNKQQ